jgi:hypothetical protein
MYKNFIKRGKFPYFFSCHFANTRPVIGNKNYPRFFPRFFFTLTSIHIVISPAKVSSVSTFQTFAAVYLLLLVIAFLISVFRLAMLQIFTAYNKQFCKSKAAVRLLNNYVLRTFVSVIVLPSQSCNNVIYHCPSPFGTKPRNWNKA